MPEPRRIRSVAALLIALVALSGCGRFNLPFFGDGGGVPATPLPFRATLSEAEDDPRDFAIVVRAQGASLDMIRETARFEATRYCLETFGGSAAIWRRDPATGDWLVRRTEDGPAVSGRCIAR